MTERQGVVSDVRTASHCLSLPTAHCLSLPHCLSLQEKASHMLEAVMAAIKAELTLGKKQVNSQA